MGLFGLLTKPLVIADKVADAVERNVVDPLIEGVEDYITGDWAGEERQRRERNR